MEKDGRVGKSLLVVPREKSGQGMVTLDTAPKRRSLRVRFCAATNNHPACNSSAQCKVTVPAMREQWGIATLAMRPASIRHFHGDMGHLCLFKNVSIDFPVIKRLISSFICVWHVCGMCVEVRGQLAGISFLPVVLAPGIELRLTDLATSMWLCQVPGY